jgi:hypothetical protein
MGAAGGAAVGAATGNTGGGAVVGLPHSRADFSLAVGIELPQRSTSGGGPRKRD